jgi:MoxR-like ATPase
MTLNSAAMTERAELSAEEVFARTTGLEREITKVVVGQNRLVQRLLSALFAAIPYSFTRSEGRAGCGHVLLEGVPGVAKTLTVTTMAHVISASFQRIQLTPDMLPADIIGTRVYEAATSTFRIERGPVFTNILLADEINRATPKTQSALLEAMQERQVTLADRTFSLEDPFWVLATQNPIEQEGVYSLPEAQLDRFSMMLRVGYPQPGEELQMLQSGFEHVDLRISLAPKDVPRIRDFICSHVYIDDRIREYIVRLGHATRHPEDAGRADLRELLVLGISPRSYQHLLALVRTTAFLNHGRGYVVPEDVKDIFADAARHRIVRSIRAQAEGVDADVILAEILSAVPLP